MVKEFDIYNAGRWWARSPKNTPGRTRTCRLLSGVAIPSGLAPPLERELKYARQDLNLQPSVPKFEAD
jgi:hypothetical protein